jgi:hypothetical protein
MPKKDKDNFPVVPNSNKESDDLGFWTDDTNTTKKEKGFFTHGTHESMQSWEDSVKVSGDGFSDSAVPKTPKTDCFYNNVINWKR